MTSAQACPSRIGAHPSPAHPGPGPRQHDLADLDFFLALYFLCKRFSLLREVEGTARGNEISVSSTRQDLVLGSGIRLEDKGAHALKGVKGRWHLYSATV